MVAKQSQYTLVHLAELRPCSVSSQHHSDARQTVIESNGADGSVFNGFEKLQSVAVFAL